MDARALHPAAAGLTRPAPRRHRSGVTLIELLLSLSVLAIIGALTVTMMVSMSRGTAHGREVRSRNLRLEVLCARIDARVRSSVRVLAVDSKSVVLWLGDERSNSVPDASELCRLEWDSTTKAVTAYVAAPDMAAADDQSYPLSTNFDTTSRNLVTAGVLEPAALGRKVRKWTVEDPGVALDAVRSITYRIELEDHAGFEHVAVAALRGE
jgi:prepilin-type N-terminal cleavage/methylation domain-containing protein